MGKHALHKLIPIISELTNQIKKKFPAKSCRAIFKKLLWGRGCSFFAPDFNIGVTLAIFRLSEKIPCLTETLKTWNRIFYKLSYASIVMLLLKSSKPAALFCFKLLNASSNSSKFNSSNCIFSL